MMEFFKYIKISYERTQNTPPHLRKIFKKKLKIDILVRLI